MKNYTAKRPGFPLPLVALAIGAVMVVFAAAHGNPESSQAAPSPVRHIIEASYTNAYGSMAGLKKDAALVVTGTVTGVAHVGYLEQGVDRVETDYSVKVSHVTFDRHHTIIKPGQVIFVRTIGGTLADGTVWEDADAPAMKVGQNLLFFLSRGETVKGASDSAIALYYWTMNGGTGRFQIAQNGTVQQSDDHGVKLPAAANVSAVEAQVSADPSN